MISGENTASARRKSTARRSAVRAARIPVDFFVIATVYLTAGMLVAPWLTPALLEYFYQPYILALVHTFTVGWITAAMMGVLYRYAPALAHRPLPYPRLLMPQLALFVIGSSGMIAHFALGSWSGVWSAALVLIASVALFAANVVPCVWPEFGRGIAQTGITLAIGFLIAAGALGFLLALDKSVGFMRDGVIANLAAHAQLAAIGWVGITLCALSYRMLPAFIGAEAIVVDRRRWQVYALGGGAIALAVALLAGPMATLIPALAIASVLGAYIISVVAMILRRRPIPGWTPPHAAAGAAWLLAAVAMGVALTITGAETSLGSRVAVAYGVAGLLGWFGNFIIGMSYHLFPGAVVHARAAAGKVSLAHALIARPSGRWLVFAGFDSGLALLVFGTLDARGSIALVGAALTSAGGLLYAAAMLRSLAFAYRS